MRLELERAAAHVAESTGELQQLKDHVAELDSIGRTLATSGDATPRTRRNLLDDVRTRQDELAAMFRRANSAADLVSRRVVSSRR